MVHHLNVDIPTIKNQSIVIGAVIDRDRNTTKARDQRVIRVHMEALKLQNIRLMNGKSHILEALKVQHQEVLIQIAVESIRHPERKAEEEANQNRPVK